jgi:RNA polymerase sigma factor (sigma-70 family)
MTLMRRVAAGDAEAQRELAERLVRRVRRIASALMGLSPDVDDAALYALIELLRAAHTYRGDTSLERWADQRAGRSVVRFARAVRRRALAGAALGAQQTTGKARVPTELEVGLDRMPESLRESLVLRHVLGFTIEEIAEATQVSPHTAQDRLLAARREFRKIFGGPEAVAATEERA